MRLNAVILSIVCLISAATAGLAGDPPFDPSVARGMTAGELKGMLDHGKKVLIVDGRDDLAGEIIKGAVQVTEEHLVIWSDTAPKDIPIVFYCTCDDDGIGIANVMAMQNLGFKNTFYLKGGLDAARAAGIPVVAP